MTCGRKFEQFDWTPERLQQAWDLKQQGVTQREIARILGTSLHSAAGKLQRMKREKQRCIDSTSTASTEAKLSVNAANAAGGCAAITESA